MVKIRCKVCYDLKRSQLEVDDGVFKFVLQQVRHIHNKQAHGEERENERTKKSR